MPDATEKVAFKSHNVVGCENLLQSATVMYNQLELVFFFQLKKNTTGVCVGGQQETLIGPREVNSSDPIFEFKLAGTYVPSTLLIETPNFSNNLINDHFIFPKHLAMMAQCADNTEKIAIVIILQLV